MFAFAFLGVAVSAACVVASRMSRKHAVLFAQIGTAAGWVAVIAAVVAMSRG